MANEVKDVNPKEKMWLVRSSTKVIGPYNLEDIVQLLVFNQISFVDEIRRPKSRWNYIREYPYLTETVKAKRELLTPEQTKTSPITSLTQQTTTNTDIASKTPPSIQVNFDDIKDIEPLKETPFSFAPKGKVTAAPTAKAFGSLEDQNVKAQLSSNNKVLKTRVIVLSVLIIIILSSVKVYQRIQDAKKVKEKISQISRLYNLKLYEEAHVIYEDLKEENEIPAEIVDQLSAARISYGKESTQVRMLIQKNIEKVTNIKKKGEYLNLVGLSYQVEGDSVKANEFYQNSAVQDPNNEWAIINTGILKIKKTKSLFMNNDLRKDVLSFYKNFSDVRSENFENLNYYHFLKALLNLEFKDILKDEISLNVKELFNIKNKTAFLRNEIQVLSIGLKKAEGTLSDDDYIELIESLPKQGKKFTRNPLVDWSLTDWGFLDEICDKIVGNSNQLMPLLFKAYCSLEAGQFEKSEELMDKSLLLARGSNHYELMQLHIAFAKSENLKIDFLLKKSDLSNFAVTYYYKGMHCLNNKNLNCAKEAFTTLQSKFSDWSYLAQHGLYLADNKTSKQNIYEGSRKEPLYKPLLSERAFIEKIE
jgi:tetratricopeptide (TPR) repeat protein